MTLADDRADQQEQAEDDATEDAAVTPSKAVVKPSPGRVAAALQPSRRPDVDLSEPTRPEWLSSRESIQATAVQWWKRVWHRAKRVGWNTPKVLLLLVAYSPRGLARVIARLAAYLYDYDSASVRHHHAGKTETAEYVKAQNVRKANLRARWMVFSAGFTLVTAPILAYLLPIVFGVAVGAVVFVFVVKLIPGRSFGELVVGFFVGIGFGVGAWWATDLLPNLPLWPFIALLAALDLVLGWIGRPERPLVNPDASGALYALEKPTADLVIRALTRLGIRDLTEKTSGEVRVYAPGVARASNGYTVELELPGAVTAAEVMDKRKALAGGLRRPLGTVWPGTGPLHPGHLRLFIGDEPMAKSPQGKWKVAQGRELDVFELVELFTDQQGEWVSLRFAYNAFVVGGAPGFGKSVALRELGVAIAFDPRTKIITLDGKGNGDMRPLRLVAHGFYEGDEDDEIDDQLLAVRAIREEMRRRARFLRELPMEENPLNKVTSQLVNKYPSLAPIVLLVDEVQTYTEHEDKPTRDTFVRLFTDLVKRGRSAGIIPVFCTQKPDAASLPSAIKDNCTMRLCFKVNGQVANDAILGNEMHSAGIKATVFSTEDKGIAYLKGDGDAPRVVRTVAGRKREGLDQVEAEELCALARQIRERKGLLSGYAAGEEAGREQEQVDFLADCREVMDVARLARIQLGPLQERLALLRPGTWSHLDVEALGGMLRAAGVPVRQVKVEGRNTSGIRREDLDVSATSDLALNEAGDDHALPRGEEQ